MIKKNTNDEVTSKKVASVSSKLLKDTKSSSDTKKVAGSALTQTPNKSKPTKKKN